MSYMSTCRHETSLSLISCTIADCGLTVHSVTVAAQPTELTVTVMSPVGWAAVGSPHASKRLSQKATFHVRKYPASYLTNNLTALKLVQILSYSAVQHCGFRRSIKKRSKQPTNNALIIYSTPHSCLFLV